MTQKPIHQQIFLWVETIMAVRILLFAAPVLIYKCQTASAWGSSQDWWVMGTALVSLAYLIAGACSLSGYQHWRILQYAAAAMTIVLTGLLYSGNTISSGIDIKAVIPAGLSVLIVFYVYLTRERPAV